MVRAEPEWGPCWGSRYLRPGHLEKFEAGCRVRRKHAPGPWGEWIPASSSVGTAPTHSTTCRRAGSRRREHSWSQSWDSPGGPPEASGWAVREAHGAGDGALMGEELGQVGLSSPAENKQGQRQMGRAAQRRPALGIFLFLAGRVLLASLPPPPLYARVPNGRLARMAQNQRGSVILRASPG